MMKRIMWIGLAFAAIPMILTAGDDATVKKELKALEGRWRIVAMSEGGKELPKDKLPAITLLCQADGTMTTQRPEGDTKHTVVLDLNKKPKRMVITDEPGTEEGGKQYAIYKLEANTLTICATRCGAPEQDRPTDFSATDAKVLLMVFERVAPHEAENHFSDDGPWDLSPPLKEPKYHKDPRYSLLVFGLKRQQRVWMVLDGTTLYVDRNRNGDLTEPGERLEPNNPKDGSNRFSEPGRHTHFTTFEFTVQAGATGTSTFQLHHWIRAATFTPQTDFDKQWHAKWLKLRWEQGTLWRKKGGQGLGQTPLWFMPKPADAQVCALDGRPTFVVRSPDHLVLKRGAADNDVAFCIAVKGRPPRGVEHPFHNPLATTEVPEKAYLEVKIEYPAKTPNAVPLRHKHLLKQRC